MRTSVARKFSFEAAHFLPRYEGKCKHMHGHRWEVEVKLEGQIDPSSGMILDFSLLKKDMTAEFLELYDHKVLNDFFENPTAENIASRIFNRLRARAGTGEGVLGRVNLTSVKVWESPDSYAEVSV